MLNRAEKFETAFVFYDLRKPGFSCDLENNILTPNDSILIRKLNKMFAVFKETTVKVLLLHFILNNILAFIDLLFNFY